MSFENLSLSKINQLGIDKQVPGLDGLIPRLLADNYQEFIEALYFDIDKIVSRIQRNPELHKNDGEDRLSIEIVNQLDCYGYKASHDTSIGGHADIVVEKKDFIWIGEAKIHSSYDYLWEGFQQLCTRYSIGDSNQSEGGILIYIKNKDAKSVMAKWQNHLVTKNLDNLVCNSCQNRSLAFFSIHKHTRSGLSFKVRHIPVMLHHDPQDKSGRNKKNTA